MIWGWKSWSERKLGEHCPRHPPSLPLPLCALVQDSSEGLLPAPEGGRSSEGPLHLKVGGVFSWGVGGMGGAWMVGVRWWGEACIPRRFWHSRSVEGHGVGEDEAPHQQQARCQQQ